MLYWSSCVAFSEQPGAVFILFSSSILKRCKAVKLTINPVLIPHHPIRHVKTFTAVKINIEINLRKLYVAFEAQVEEPESRNQVPTTP
jgi:hypothetical protein